MQATEKIMKKILIFGAGGFGREVQWLIERINQKKPTWEIEGYLDDGVQAQTEINSYKVLGGMEKLKEYNAAMAVVVALQRVGLMWEFQQKTE